jgi:hypothetical protein
MDSSKHSILKIEPLGDEAQTIETVFPSSAGFVSVDKTFHRSDKIYEKNNKLPVIVETITPTLHESTVTVKTIELVSPNPTVTQTVQSAHTEEIEPIDRHVSKNKSDHPTVQKQGDITDFTIERSVSKQEITKSVKIVKSVSLSTGPSHVYTVENASSLVEISNKCKIGDHLILMAGIYPLLVIKGGVSYSGQGQVTIQNINIITGKESSHVDNIHFNIAKSPINCQCPVIFDRCKFDFIGSPTAGNLSGIQIIENTDFINCQFNLDYNIPKSNISGISILNGTVTIMNSKIEINNGVGSLIEFVKLGGKKSNLTAIGNLIYLSDKGGSKFIFASGNQLTGPVFLTSNIITGNNGDSKNRSMSGLCNVNCLESGNVLKMLPENNWSYLKVPQQGKKVKMVRSNYQILEDDYKLLIASSSPITLTLPLSRGNPDNSGSFMGLELKIKSLTQGVNHQLVTQKGNLINGQNNLSIGFQQIEVVNWGPQWFCH